MASRRTTIGTHLQLSMGSGMLPSLCQPSYRANRPPTVNSTMDTMNAKTTQRFAAVAEGVLRGVASRRAPFAAEEQQQLVGRVGDGRRSPRASIDEEAVSRYATNLVTAIPRFATSAATMALVPPEALTGRRWLRRASGPATSLPPSNVSRAPIRMMLGTGTNAPATRAYPWTKYCEDRIIAGGAKPNAVASSSTSLGEFIAHEDQVVALRQHLRVDLRGALGREEQPQPVLAALGGDLDESLDQGGLQ